MASPGLREPTAREGSVRGVTFKVVDRSHIPQKSGRGKDASELSLALARGEAVFIESPADGRPPAAVMNLYAKNSYLRVRGLQPRQRRGIEDGAEGIFVWAEKVDTNGSKP
jgi:hypothetical protein